MNDDILEFRGDYRFLSNFWPCYVYYQGLRYPSAEHAYQAAKTLNISDREHIAHELTAGQAKRFGKKVVISHDFNENKILIMETILREKFNDPHLGILLLATKDAHIVEGNAWGDKFWGMCEGEGKNHLGKLLMKIRKSII